MTVLSQILQHKIVAIIRGANPSDVVSIAEALHQGGVKLLEVTLNSSNALELIKELSAKMDGKMLIGAGTVLNASMAKQAIDAGAKFIISPSLNIETIQITKKLGAVSIPGAFTATEIVTAFDNGGDIIKVFPASGVDYIKNIRGPLDHIPLMPTGGVTLSNVSDYFKAGAVAVGIGSDLVNTKLPVDDEYLEHLRIKANAFMQIAARSAQ
jgi:2-dehydro-3-deoxyphosphogluconate aldolase / (4S)-4-hydroxy-2-oxoglutarate aldolase